MTTPKFNLPPTNEQPDNSYFDSQVVSYNFAVDGHKATLGFIQPGFEGTFPVGEGGEDITLTNPVKGSELTIDVMDGNGDVEGRHSLAKEGDSISVPEGKQMKISTAGAIVEYVCVYPGQPEVARVPKEQIDAMYTGPLAQRPQIKRALKEMHEQQLRHGR